MTTAEIAQILGLGDAYGVLRKMMLDYGNPSPGDLRKLPSDFLRGVLKATDTSPDEMSTALESLRQLVLDAPQDEAERLEMAFNFGESQGKLQWTTRVRRFADEKGTNESQVRKKVDTDLLLLILRTKDAAEKQPEVLAPAELVGRGASVADFFNQGYVRNSEEFQLQWSTAATVDMSGFGHNRMLVSYSSELQSLLRRGGRVRVLMQDPDGAAILGANFRSSTPKAASDDARSQQRVGIATLAALRKRAGEASLDARLYDIAPPFTAYFFDAEADNGVAFVWFWSWRQASSERPGFAVWKADDELWFHRFYSQFTALWADDEVTKPVVWEGAS